MGAQCGKSSHANSSSTTEGEGWKGSGGLESTADITQRPSLEVHAESSHALLPLISERDLSDARDSMASGSNDDAAKKSTTNAFEDDVTGDVSAADDSRTHGDVDNVRRDRAAGESVSGGAAVLVVDEETASRIRAFYDRNRRENQRHATMMARSKEATKVMSLLAETDGGKHRVEQFDVFSPDMRSTRWAEFLELFAQDSGDFDRFKESSAITRGTGKAMTLGAVTRKAATQELH